MNLYQDKKEINSKPNILSTSDTISNKINYPRQMQFQTYQGTTFSKFDTQGSQLLDKYVNLYYINKFFAITNGSALLCSDKIMVGSDGNLKVYITLLMRG
jgi:hypothetical protein